MSYGQRQKKGSNGLAIALSGLIGAIYTILIVSPARFVENLHYIYTTEGFVLTAILLLLYYFFILFFGIILPLLVLVIGLFSTEGIFPKEGKFFGKFIVSLNKNLKAGIVFFSLICISSTSVQSAVFRTSFGKYILHSFSKKYYD